ncbi:MAG: hypothetical protein JNM24_01425 [Bdellovibrionaceae bacterium]|nr:hypothetical protein [Pseudobdellovibrionaceae bacterium]
MKKSTFAYILGAAAVVIGGVYFAFKFGLKPQPIPKIKWSHFTNPEEYGASVYKRLRLEVLGQNLVFLGVLPERKNHYLAWKGFFDSLEAENKFQHIIIDSTLSHKDLIPSTEVISMIENQAAVVATIKDIIATKKRVAIILPTTYMSSLVKDNFYALLTRSLYQQDDGRAFDVDWMTLSLSSFPMSREDEPGMEIPCDTDVKDSDGSGELGCAVVMKARALYRKKDRVEGKLPGVLDQIGTKEYLGLLN